MKVDSAVWEGGFLKLHTADVDARHFAYAFTPGEYEINVKKSLRSLDANAYAWTLIDKLAKATGRSCVRSLPPRRPRRWR